MSEFAGHGPSEQPIKAWVDAVTRAQWRQPADIKTQYRSASVLKSRRVVFNIKGNDFRLVVAVAYNTGVVFIKFHRHASGLQRHRR